MKILKEPDKVFKCEHCGCEFTMEPGDKMNITPVKNEYGFLFLPTWDDAYTVRCPSCGREVFVKWL